MYWRLIFLSLLLPLGTMAQNVGIGTKTPATRLHVVDSAGNAEVKIESPNPSGDETNLRLQAGSNGFNFLRIGKYAPGALGSLAGIAKDNLSVLATGGNGGPLLLYTGDGVSPLLFAAGTGERMRINGDGKVGIGTTAPATAYNLHVHSNDIVSGGDVSIGITNGFTTDANGRGARLRMNAYDLAIINNETTGKISLSTNANQRLLIMPNGNIGINNLNPAYLLDVEASGSRGINIRQTGGSSDGLVISSTLGNTNNKGILVTNPTNFSLPNNYAVGVHAISGSGSAFSLSTTSNYGLIGECRNPAGGIGILGVSNSPSPQLIEAGVVGTNFSTAASSYGVIGSSSGSSGAGTVGFTDNATAGLLGYAFVGSTGPAIKSVSLTGTSGIGLELENGAIKVSGTNRSAFRHVSNISNTLNNETVLPTTVANSFNDLVFVTVVWEGVYLNVPVGVYFQGGSWRIFRQDLQAMPLNTIFNVMVIKQ